MLPKGGQELDFGTHLDSIVPGSKKSLIRYDKLIFEKEGYIIGLSMPKLQSERGTGGQVIYSLSALGGCGGQRRFQ